ncbi:MAG: hypothetical protein HKN92_11300 [Chitinophagales bacterium]|nr:hypothetical protein [Chitinophagales bacterium]
MDRSSAIHVAKELIPYLTFPDIDVLTSKNLMKERDEEIKKALLLGNGDHEKVRIYFEDKFSLKQVETTIWGMTEKHIILKKNTLIPKKAIRKIHFN